MYKKIQQKLFSEREVTDLLKAWIAISLAFGIVISGFSFTLKFAYSFLLASLTVGIGFLFHELSHRAVARHFGCRAEFRSFDPMLVLAILMSFLGFVFVAPGAVMISGPVGKIRNGIISAAGPAANLILSSVFLILYFALTPVDLLKNIIVYGFLINSWLALFNLIPIGNFDGIKILHWDKAVYAVMAVIAIIFVFSLGAL